MKIKRMLFAGSMLIFTTLALAGCAAKTNTAIKKIEGLDSMGNITVVTREEGSGTRGVFAEKVSLENKESNSSNADKIRADAQIAMNADSVIQSVAGDENAIGYVSLGALSGDAAGIKVIAVDGITPDPKTIGNDQYPLTRNFNIAYSGKNTPVGSDFLTYILSAGQEIAANDYISVKKSTTFLSDRSEGTLTVSGSSSAAPLLEELAKDYSTNYNSKAQIEVQISDSTAGLTAAMQGSSDWGIASRELKDYEKELLTYKTIAKDGVAVIVNESNPAESLSVNQLTQIFDGTDQKWGDVNQ